MGCGAYHSLVLGKTSKVFTKVRELDMQAERCRKGWLIGSRRGLIRGGLWYLLK